MPAGGPNGPDHKRRTSRCAIRRGRRHRLKRSSLGGLDAPTPQTLSAMPSGQTQQFMSPRCERDGYLTMIRLAPTSARVSGKSAYARSLLCRKFREENNRFVAAVRNLAGIDHHARNRRALKSKSRMAPRETQEQFRQRLETPRAFERGSAFFDVEALRGTFIGTMVQAEARGCGRFRESRAHSWEGCAKLPRDGSVSKDGCIFLHNAIKDSACSNRATAPKLPSMRPVFARLILFGMLVLCTGCSDFDQRWSAERSRSTTETEPFAGAYQGTWESSRYKGASGKLWCVLKRRAPDLYEAEFRATWHGIFSSRHKVSLRVFERNGRGKSATARIGGGTEIRMWVGSGHYRCEGMVTTTGLIADYDAEIDRGKFLLSRVQPGTRP